MAAAIPIRVRADRAIMKRQKQEFIHETLVAQELDAFAVKQKGLWENQTAAVIRGNRVKGKAAAMEAQHKASLQQRRQKLAHKLSAEMKAYEREMVEREETPQQRMDKMAVRAYELKKRREEERKAVVQEKLYQQWRAGVDDLRTMDSKLVELKTIADRDFQLDEKAAMKAEEKAHDEFYDQVWHEGYLAKIEREEREKEMKRERNDQQTRIIDMQLNYKQQKAIEEKEQVAAEAEEMKKLWAAQEQEEKDALVRERIIAKEERKKADEYMAIQQRQRAEEDRLERDFDENFVQGVLERERRLAEQEEFEKKKAKQKAIEYTEALKIEMAKKAESEEELVRLQHEESERQWEKRYKQWEKEELARRALMEEVYTDRAEQVRLKQGMRENLKQDVLAERDMVDMEVQRLESIEKERMEGEALVGQRHQEELFRQMDFHQVQRHRQLQQHAIEQRQAAIAEEKIRRAVNAERATANEVMKEILHKRATQRPHATVTAPWER
uniref:Cilia- and flagella-associated protein 53 n=1 Tax=Alexandrium monilatum TaxID=311494 RepID=A0A7S4T1E9_9DINO|mmetsp:Transcript_16279/g.49164  ORF Transcript_16279/g.49164 Transcript_16279/m.49164 type:complete len:499 (-) Transcript_16279:32-1528(-)